MTRLYTDDVELYDIAFDWDLADEAAWLVERLGSDCRTILEPGCGTGRLLEALGRLGLGVVGIDSSPQMVEAARRRLAGAGVEALVELADMTAFDLGRVFDGAVCPINTLLHLTRDELSRHLEAMARHVRRGGRYLVQLGLRDPSLQEEMRGSEWEATRGETRLHVTWSLEDEDPVRGTERHRSRIEVLAGERRGDVVEEVHVMTTWTPASWRQALDASPFRWAAVYDGGVAGRPRADFAATGGLLWHELVAGD